MLASLGSSHTGRYTPDQLDYYELFDVFEGNFRRDAATVFPPRGAVTYAGIGIATEVTDGKVFVTDVYDGGPARKSAGILAGDEILSVDGEPFDEIDSVPRQGGNTMVAISLRHTADAQPVTVNVGVDYIEPGDNFLAAIRNSAQVIERGGHKIGVIHLWSYTTDDVTQILYDEIAGQFKDVDGLVLDLRGRWGGTPADAGETFLGGTSNMFVTGQDGKVQYVNERFHKPVVAIIDAGTRSGMEILAYSLKKNGVHAGRRAAPPATSSAAAGFLLPDDSLLELAVQDVNVDGIRLENNPVQPDVAVPFDVRYADGHDPQFDAALTSMPC